MARTEGAREGRRGGRSREGNTGWTGRQASIQLDIYLKYSKIQIYFHKRSHCNKYFGDIFKTGFRFSSLQVIDVFTGFIRYCFGRWSFIMFFVASFLEFQAL